MTWLKSIKVWWNICWNNGKDQTCCKYYKKRNFCRNKIIAVVSAMAGKTNELVKLSKEISEEFNKREFDVLVSSGEQVTCALLSGALINLEIKAISLMNWQIRFLLKEIILTPDYKYAC